ncbi:MspA family porin [Nocardia sp. NPDC050175]|uniref:MspA family porin n=1 Tax=Nocardia sp. NPDC050175 TaxID=3364317 RepID=UPI0037A087E0
MKPLNAERKHSMRLVLGSCLLSLALPLTAATPASAKFVDPATLPVRIGHQLVKRTMDGYSFMIIEANTAANSTPPLDQNPFSKEAFLSGIGIGQVDGPKRGKIVSAVLEVGYEIGYPVALAPNGITATLNSPSVAVTGNAKPKIAGTTSSQSQSQSQSQSESQSESESASSETPLNYELGGEFGALATVLPSQQTSFQVGHGGIVATTLATVALTQPMAYADLSNTHLTVTGAFGPVTVRTFVKFTLVTPGGQTSEVVYSDPIELS